jgi:predicted Rossmann fold nucleotide-binding protein DprA/Smf involved in DNA uptake
VLPALSRDAEALLLLCGRFPPSQDGEIQEVSPSECRRLLHRLAQREIPPSALLEDKHALDDSPIDAIRLRALLGRNEELAEAVADWSKRGIWVLCGADDAYPARVRVLGAAAPPLIYGAGDIELVTDDGPALAVVGSRDSGRVALKFARAVGSECARLGIRVVSGSARGVDSEAMRAALVSGGVAVGVLSDSLAAAASARRYRELLTAGSLALISTYGPYTPFSVGNAMGRNKYIYALADAALVIWSTAGSGGTWSGATEALEARKTPVYVWCDDGVPDGNQQLASLGAAPVSEGSWRAALARLRKEAGDREAK